MLFFDFRRVVDAISFEASNYAPAGGRNPFDLAPVWRYFSVLIPYATYPLLWLLIYLSTLYVILRPVLWPIVIPLCLFAALYTYSMAKGYIDLFARLVMLLLPVFCILAGLAFEDILPKLKRRLLFALVMILILLLIMPTILFDWAYGRAMRGRDVREMLRNDMRELIKDRSSTTIAVSETCGYFFYTAMPAVFPLASNNVTVQLESTFTGPADFLVMGFGWPLTENARNDSIREVKSGGTFKLVKGYSHAPSIFGKTLDLSTFPPDMTYPFPTILLFRNVTEP
jgi:hypothetical protein